MTGTKPCKLNLAGVKRKTIRGHPEVKFLIKSASRLSEDKFLGGKVVNKSLNIVST